VADTGRRIARNTAYLTIGKLLGDLCSFGFLVYFARIFGAGTLGKYAFAMAFAGVLAMFVSMGMNTYMAREVSKNRQDLHKYVSNGFVTQALLAILVWGAVCLYAVMVNTDPEMRVIILLIGLYQTLYALTGVFRTQFVVHEQMQYVALTELAHKLVILAFGSWAIWATQSAVLAVAVYPVGAMLMFLLAGVWSVKLYGWPRVKPDWLFIKRVLRHSAPFLMLMMLTVVFDRSGMILLAALKGNVEAGLYSAPDRLLVTALQPVMMFGAAMIPVMSRLAYEDSGKLMSLYEKSVKLVVIFLLPLSTLWFLVAREVIVAVYGEQFSEAGEAMQVLCWLLLVNGLLVVTTTMMMANNHEQNLLKGKLVIAVIYIMAILLLIPAYGYLGLASAKLCAFVCLSLFSLHYLKRTMPLGKIWMLVRGPAVACVVASAFYIYMPAFEIWIRALAMVTSCFVLMYLLRVIRVEDILYIRRVLKGSRPRDSWAFDE